MSTMSICSVSHGKVIQVWNNMGLTKYLDNFHFWFVTVLLADHLAGLNLTLLITSY